MNIETISSMFNFLFKSRVSKPSDEERAKAHAQYLVNRAHIKTVLREELNKAVKAKTAALPPPRFAVSDVVRVVCTQENFRYGWFCLGHPFKIGQDEQGTIKSVSVDYSRLEEMVVNDYFNGSFQCAWARNHPNDLSIHDLNTFEFRVALNKFISNIDIGHAYRIEFENPAVKVFWDFPEEYLEYPLAIQVA